MKKVDILSNNKIKSAIGNAYNTQSNKNPRKLKHAEEKFVVLLTEGNDQGI